MKKEKNKKTRTEDFMTRPAMTLIEVMIALAIFGIAAGGIVSTSSLAHRTAIENIADSIALHTAESIMEQIRIMPYESTLLPLCGTTGTLEIDRYVPANIGSPAKIETQSIQVNRPYPVYLKNVTLSSSINANSVQISSANLPMAVRIIINEATTTNAPGITVELIYYRYRTISSTSPMALNATTPIAIHALRTFIPKSLQ